MNKTEERCYLTFPALTQVLKAEKLLSSHQLEFWVVPLPREISSDCGMCIMCRPETFDSIKEVLAAQGIGYEQTFVLQKKKLKFFK